MRALTLLVLLLLPAMPARADQETLLPPATQVRIRAFGLGLFPPDGNFTRFTGWIRYDPFHPAACEVSLRVDAASLTAPNQSIRDQILGAKFMDVARFPDLSFNGTCRGGAIEGTLLLHGETHPFALDLDRHGATTTGRLRRGDWGMTYRSLTAGSTIRIQVEAPSPFGNPQRGAAN